MRVTTPSDRVQVIGRAQLKHPGACALCGNGTCDEGYVNTGIYFDYEGHIYLCMRCAIQIAETIGCLTPPESLHLVTLSEEVIKERDLYKEQLEDATNRLQHFDALIGPLITDGTVTVNSSDPEPETVEVGTGESGPSSEPAVSGAEPDSEPTEPVKKSGPTNSKRTPVRDRSFQV